LQNFRSQNVTHAVFFGLPVWPSVGDLHRWCLGEPAPGVRGVLLVWVVPRALGG
jgi:hypothetical protein